MTVPVVFLPEARAEFDEAIEWYRRHSSQSKRFIANVEAVLVRISANPKLHQKVYHDVRRAVVKSFPYLVLYQDDATNVLIVSVFHCSRSPSIWQARAK